MTYYQLFGTDGIRGHVTSANLQPENIAKVGRIIGHLAQGKGAENCSVTIGRDTRASGVYLQYALVAGITATGVDCNLVGVLPTAALAYATKVNRSSFGIMISASHNPYHDNGIKVFDEQGFKINEATEKVIEKKFLMLLG